MNNLAVGIELLFTGMTITFLTLVFLMYLMKATSALINRQLAPEEEPAMPSPTSAQPAKVSSEELVDEELVAISAALGRVLPANQQAVIRVTSARIIGAEEEEMVAAIAGALAAR